MRKKELAVGDSTDVELIFNTGHYTSRVNKSASVISNSQGVAPSLNIAAFPVNSVDSLKLFTVSPSMIALDSVRPEQQKKPWQYDLTVRNVGSESIELTLVSIPLEFVQVDLPGGSIKPGSEKSIHVKLDKSISDQIFNKSFTFEASDSARTRYTVPIAKAMRWGPAPTSN